jgi:hypothetical protein
VCILVNIWGVFSCALYSNGTINPLTRPVSSGFLITYERSTLFGVLSEAGLPKMQSLIHHRPGTKSWSVRNTRDTEAWAKWKLVKFCKHIHENRFHFAQPHTTTHWWFHKKFISEASFRNVYKCLTLFKKSDIVKFNTTSNTLPRCVWLCHKVRSKLYWIQVSAIIWTAVRQGPKQENLLAGSCKKIILLLVKMKEKKLLKIGEWPTGCISSTI